MRKAFLASHVPPDRGHGVRAVLRATRRTLSRISFLDEVSQHGSLRLVVLISHLAAKSLFPTIGTPCPASGQFFFDFKTGMVPPNLLGIVTHLQPHDALIATDYLL